MLLVLGDHGFGVAGPGGLDQSGAYDVGHDSTPFNPFNPYGSHDPHGRTPRTSDGTSETLYARRVGTWMLERKPRRGAGQDHRREPAESIMFHTRRGEAPRSAP
ncbi:hypothetical protein GCM10018987_05850 [Streptomyces cremeus]